MRFTYQRIRYVGSSHSFRSLLCNRRWFKSPDKAVNHRRERPHNYDAPASYKPSPLTLRLGLPYPIKCFSTPTAQISKSVPFHLCYHLRTLKNSEKDLILTYMTKSTVKITSKKHSQCSHPDRRETYRY